MSKEILLKVLSIHCYLSGIFASNNTFEYPPQCLRLGLNPTGNVVGIITRGDYYEERMDCTYMIVK